MKPRSLILLWYLTDLLIFVGAYALAYFLRLGFIFSSDFPFDRFIIVAGITGLAWLFVLASTGLFHVTRNQMRLKNAQYIAFSSIIGTSLFALIYYFVFEETFSRLLLGLTFILSTGLIFLWHIIYQQFMRRSLRASTAFPTLIIGVTRESKELIANLNRSKNPLKPVAILDGRGTHEKEIDGVPVLGKLNKLEEVLEEHKITHLIQASDIEQSINLLSACRNRKATYLLLPSVLGIVERDERVQSIEGQSVVVVNP